MPELTSKLVDSQCHGPKWAPACHSGLDKLRRDPAWLPSDQHKSDISAPDLPARQPGCGPLWATDIGRYPLVSGATREIPPQGPRFSPASWHPVPLQAGPLGHRKVRWSVGQPSLPRLPALQHLPGCLFLKSYLNTPPPGDG